MKDLSRRISWYSFHRDKNDERLSCLLTLFVRVAGNPKNNVFVICDGCEQKAA